MAVKVSLKELEVIKQKAFPKLMISDRGMIVFFSESKKGMVFSADREKFYPILKYSEDWRMEVFKDYNDPITIQNE